MSGNQFTRQGIEAFVFGLKANTSLKKVVFNNCWLTDSAIQELLNIVLKSNLAYLSIANNEISHKSTIPFFRALSKVNGYPLKRLNINDN